MNRSRVVSIIVAAVSYLAVILGKGTCTCLGLWVAPAIGLVVVWYRRKGPLHEPTPWYYFAKALGWFLLVLPIIIACLKHVTAG